MSTVGRRRLLGLVGVVVVFAAWEAAARLGLINVVLLSSPTQIAQAGVTEVESGSLWVPLWTSFLEYLLGVALGIVVGIPLGLLAGWYRRLGYAVDPWLTVLNSTPVVALVPLFIIAFGIGLESKVVIIFFFAVFPIAINTFIGVHATASRYLRVARSFRATDPMILRTVIIPGTAPFILTGARVGGGHAFVGLIVAEFLAGSSGIGYLMSVAGDIYNTSLLMFLLAILGCAGVAYSVVLHRLEARVERWRPEAQRA